MSASPANDDSPAEVGPICSRPNWSIYWILIVCSLAMVAARVGTVGNHGARGESPFFSANDRSRWCTIRSLGDEGVYEIDTVCNNRGQAIDWDTIDKVRHVGRDGRFHFYSSKPPLLPTLLAGLYCCVKQVTGTDLEHDPQFIARAVLLIVNVVPFGLYLWLLAGLVEGIQVSDWTRYFILASAGFGTFLSTFAVTLNNHLPAAFSITCAIFGLVEIWKRSSASWVYYSITGLFAAFAAANELPALAFFAIAGAMVVYRSVVKSIVAFLPAAMLVGAAFFVTNYLAHDQWRLAYSHRGEGALLTSLDGDFEESLNAGNLPTEIQAAVQQLVPLEAPQVEISQWPEARPGIDRWTVRDLVTTAQLTIVKRKETSSFEVRAWDNWYDYPGSYWLASNEKRSRVDRGQTWASWYAFHMLFGHHGIFSLTPIWLLSVAGMMVLVFSGRWPLRWLGWMGITLSVVVIAFYITRPAIDRNYGGWTSGLRWVFWLAPIWLMCMLPVVDWLGRTGSGRTFCLILLSISAVSAMYSMENPWVHPWLYEIWDLTGLPK